MSKPSPGRISLAIVALGGQGGGVLADWLAHLGTHNGYFVQSTSVPGVAQRTGSTVYYIEYFPDRQPNQTAEPVLALAPIPGDVDIVLSLELMEAGRAILRGFVGDNRAVLITSTHRVYTIAEKSAMAGELADGRNVLEAAKERAKMFVSFDMEEISSRTSSAISAVMLGAVAGSGALPFTRAQFETAIRTSNITIESNLGGFAAGFDVAAHGTKAPKTTIPSTELPQPTSRFGAQLSERLFNELPERVHRIALEGIRRLMDYQDSTYAELYLDRLVPIRGVDSSERDWMLTREVARYLALWMSYEDTIRVADLKTRGSRVERVRREIETQPDQLVHVTEYMHPRWQEVCETMPAWLGERLFRSGVLTRCMSGMFKTGRHVTTTKIGWFLLMYGLAALRRFRRGTLRYRQEQIRIEAWLALVCNAAASDWQAAYELVECQRLIKGYSETHARGLRNFSTIVAVYHQMKDRPDIAQTIRRLREAALKDEDGLSLKADLAEIGVIA